MTDIQRLGVNILQNVCYSSQVLRFDTCSSGRMVVLSKSRTSPETTYVFDQLFSMFRKHIAFETLRKHKNTFANPGLVLPVTVFACANGFDRHSVDPNLDAHALPVCACVSLYVLIGQIGGCFQIPKIPGNHVCFRSTVFNVSKTYCV